jgi:nucleoside-diphosphate-sugar epimerase
MKTGRMEGLLEEMRLMIDRANNSNNDEDNDDKVRLPQFVYASSHEVYDRISSAPGQKEGPNPPPFREDLPITTPSSLHGTAKLIDEVLASAYHSTHGIYSVGLRFFDVYGPWNAPGTVVFDLAERVLAANKKNDNPATGGGVDDDDDDGGNNGGLYPHHEDDVNDYVYIDDAVDAILGAMQYRPPATDGPPPPVVFNVGTGRGTALKELKAELSRHFPKALVGGGGGVGGAATSDKKMTQQRLPTKTVASTALSASLLGFEARISLEEGLAHTLTWHRDRVFPYGRNPYVEESFEVRGIEDKIAKSLATARRRASTEGEVGEGDEECSTLDRECLRDALVFPCASECRRLDRCTPSAWDDISKLSRIVTTGCDAVLYTVLLDEDADQIPSAIAATSTEYIPFVGAGLSDDVGGRTQARCNVAFVSSKSPLVKRLRSEGEVYLDSDDGDDAGGGDGGVLPPLLRHGFWTVLPVTTPSSSDINSSWLHAFDGTFALEYLPKLSPGRFFGASVRYAVYAAPTVLVKNLSNVLKRMENGPVVPSLSSEDRSSSRTALLVALRRPSCDAAQRGAPCTNTYTRPPNNDLIQSHAYNMVRIALRGDLLGGGLDPVLDSSLVVHSLREEESRLFRCDVYGEAAQWGTSSDERALEFIISLHDLWTRAFMHWSNDAAGGGEANAAKGAKNEKGESDRQQQQHRRSLLEDSSSESAEHQGKWMGILSQMDPHLFAHIMHSEDLGVIHLD